MIVSKQGQDNPFLSIFSCLSVFFRSGDLVVSAGLWIDQLPNGDAPGKGQENGL
jgi:hypothetical protein